MKPKVSAEEFDARAYLLTTVSWCDTWPRRAIEQFEVEGFAHIRIDQVKPHPVWLLWMKGPGNNLTSNRAGWIVRRVVEQSGRIPRGGFYCTADRREIVKAGFVLEV